MPLNTNIALQVRGPELESPVNQLSKVLQIQGLQQQQGLNALQADKYRLDMDEVQRGRERQNRLLTLTQSFTPDIKPEQRISALLGAGFTDEADKLSTLFANQRKADADITNQRSLAAERDFNLAKNRYTIYQTAMGALSREPNLTRDMVLQAGAGLVAQGILPQEMFEKAAANLPDDPQALKQRLELSLRTQLTPEQMLTLFAPKPTQVDSGQQISFRDTNPNSPTFNQTLGAPVQRLATPGEVLTDTRTREEGEKNRGVQVRGQDLTDSRTRDEGAANRSVTTRGQNITDARARERLAFDQGVAVTDAGGPTQAALAKQFGKAAPGYRWKADGSQEAIPGGPADIKAGEAGARRERQTQGAIDQAERVIAKVDEALLKVSKGTAGLGGSIMARVPGTEAVDLRGALETIKANLGFAELQAMREASPTGGALGQVAVQELIALQSTVASLDPSQSPAQLRANLAQVKKHYDNWKTTLQGRMPGQTPKAEPGQLGSGTAPVGSPPADIDSLLKKYGKK